MRGCGSSCHCPRMKNNWDYYESCLNYLNLIRDGFITLDDVDDVDWATMNGILREEAHQKEIIEQHNKQLKEMGLK